MVYLKTQIDLLTKHLLSGKIKKVKVVISQDRVDVEQEEEATYVNNQRVSKAIATEIKDVPRTEQLVIKLLSAVMMNYESESIEEYEETPLEKEVKFFFDDECLKVFECLKKKMIKAPIVIAPDWVKPFVRKCDTCGVSLGAVFRQKKDKLFYPIY
ncbi:uncharacterized protein LOC124896203 [Capsicum annuum]|uniref:uncharacterized protein LOC124896203 n=1 Tax=Capsicum annuum TaxID=4072 RepID=UPI001FB0FF49|nr:uncharacterized protein LOC124896203 [Capsicum annuum]